MPETDLIATIVQGGAVGIALVCLFLIYKFVTNHGHDWKDAVDRNTEAWGKNAEVTAKLQQFLEDKLK